MHQPALDNYRGREISPGAECQSDAELDEFVRNHAETAFHPCGTCKWATTRWRWWMAKVGFTGWKAARGRRPIMPQITGNLNATTIMIGENG
ncbi:MAG: hypothetical protein ACLR17_17740 [Enterobacteriaceae bacterium]